MGPSSKKDPPGFSPGGGEKVVVAVKDNNKVKLEDWRYPYLMNLGTG